MPNFSSLFQAGQLQRQPGDLLAELAIAVQHAALGVGFVQLRIIVGDHGENRHSQHLFQLARGDIQTLGRAVENQPDAVLAVSAVEQRLDDLFGLVQRRHLQRGHQAGLVDFFQRGHGDVAQAAAQVDQRPVVVRPREGQHVAHLLVLELLLGSQGQRRGHDLDARNAVRDQRLPVVDVQAMQIVDGVQNGVHRLGFGDEADHAGIQVEIRQQHFLILPAQLGGHVADQRGGAAAALGGEEREALAARPWRPRRAGGCVPRSAFRARAAAVSRAADRDIR